MSRPVSTASTIQDVARLANVSVATVSRILNGSAGVSQAKRLAVLAAIERLQFRPNLHARTLRGGSSRLVGVLTQELESPYFARATLGVEDGLAGSGYTPVVVPGHSDADQEFERAQLLIARRVDALVILGGSLADTQLASLASTQPTAVTGRQVRVPGITSFHCDQAEGARLATQHLIGLGHRRIAHIAGPPGQADTLERREGYLAAHRDAALSVDPRLLLDGTYLEAGGDRAMAALLSSGTAFSAVFCANDQTLWGARLALYRRGLRVPEDVSLVGFDDLPQSAYMTPPVTTVHQPIFEMGRAAALAVLRQLGVATSEAGHPPLHLVVRGSSAPPGA